MKQAIKELYSYSRFNNIEIIKCILHSFDKNNPFLRAWIARQPKIPRMTFVRLSEDEYDEVRIAVASNWHTPIEVLIELSGDHCQDVVHTVSKHRTFKKENNMNYIMIERLGKGETVKFRPHGNSMIPLIYSGQLITVSPDISNLEIGDIVFCKVSGKKYVHKITKINQDGRYMISNNKGRENGWTNTIYGKVILIED